MSGKIQEDDLDTAAAEFINTFNDFKKAAKKLMVIMDSISVLVKQFYRLISDTKRCRRISVTSGCLTQTDVNQSQVFELNCFGQTKLLKMRFPKHPACLIF